MKHEYHLECDFAFDKQWHTFKKGISKNYGHGYIDAMRDQYPRLALRMVDSGGRIMDSVNAASDVSVGMIAGWPTAEQYEVAAQRALEKAAHIRAQQKKEEDRRNARHLSVP
jgi:hypothetical protein